MEQIKDRISDLEESVLQTNEEIEALQSIINALQNNLYITSVEQTADGYTIVFSDGTSASIMNGKDGANGADGYSPTAIVEQTSTGAKITITDKNGTTTATVNHGKDGEGGSGGSITLDTEMSDTSENAVQNKVIKAYVDGLVGNIESLLAEV